MRRIASLLALLTMVVAGSPARAVTASDTTVDIAVSPAGFAAPDTISAGRVTLRISSTDPQGAWIGLVRLHGGVTLDHYLTDLVAAMSNDPATAQTGGRAVEQEVDMLGGAAVAAVPASATLYVAPGDYYLVDFRDVGLPDLAARVHPVHVAGSVSTPPPAPRSAVIAQVDTPNGPRFLAPSRLATPTTVRVVNLSGQADEAMLMPVRPGTTLADLDAFYAALEAGGYPSNAPFIGGPTGIVPLSPGRTATLSEDLPAGEYALTTWVRDTRDGQHGRMLAAEGQRALLTVGG